MSTSHSVGDELGAAAPACWSMGRCCGEVMGRITGDLLTSPISPETLSSTLSSARSRGCSRTYRTILAAPNGGACPWPHPATVRKSGPGCDDGNRVGSRALRRGRGLSCRSGTGGATDRRDFRVRGVRIMRRLSPLAVISVTSILLLSCAAPNEQFGGATRGYTLLDDTLDESPGKAQVTMNILVPESATDQELTALLNRLLRDASQRAGFQYHEYPTVVAIYAYASQDHGESGMGQWEAMVSKTPLDLEPSVRIRLGRGTVEEPANRFGLTRQERMAAYRQLVGAEDRGQAEAEREFPTDFSRQFERADQLGEQYKQDLADELDITRDQLDEIGVEGLQQNWQMPAL